MANPFLFPFPFLYRVILTSVDCLAKRAVSFQNDEPMNWIQIGDEATNHIYSQTCSRCGKNHCDKHYVATDIDEGTPDIYGNYNWKEVKAPREPRYTDQWDEEIHA